MNTFSGKGTTATILEVWSLLFLLVLWAFFTVTVEGLYG